jgi:hypothetical protein
MITMTPTPHKTTIPDATRTNQKKGVTMDISSLERAFFVANVVYISAVIVAAVATFFVSFFASRLTAAKDAELRRFQSESAQATAQANARAAKANARAAEANEKAEQERLARVKIEQRLADRVLTDAQVERIASKLRAFAGQAYKVTTYWDLKEPLGLANRIHELLTRAGWQYIEYDRAAMLFSGVAGVRVSVHPEAETTVQTAAMELVSALTTVGIEADVRQIKAPHNPDQTLYLCVGTKP